MHMTHIRQGEDNGLLTKAIHTKSAYYQSLTLLINKHDKLKNLYDKTVWRYTRYHWLSQMG